MYKIITYVPIKDAQKVRSAIAKAGAGVMGNYTHASFSSRGIGRFLPREGAHPAIGKVGKLEEVEEEKIEVFCREDKAKEVVEAIKAIHPYEEIPLDIYKLVSEKDF